MKDQIEMAIPRKKNVASDSNEARKMATSRICVTLPNFKTELS